MSVDSNEPLNFEWVLCNNGIGEQEFVEHHSQGIGPDGVVFTSTYYNGVPRTDSFISRLILIRGRSPSQGFVQMEPGLRVICADSTMTKARVIDVHDMPATDGEPNKVTVTDLRRGSVQELFRVCSETTVQGADELIYAMLSARSIVKRLRLRDMTSGTACTRYLGLQEKRMRMDAQQLAEFDLPLDVFAAIGAVAVEQ